MSETNRQLSSLLRQLVCPSVRLRARPPVVGFEVQRALVTMGIRCVFIPARILSTVVWFAVFVLGE